MAKSKRGGAKNESPLHYSVGALIQKNGKYLLIDRAIAPFGFAGVAGHIEEHETPQQAVVREIKEEVGLQVEDTELLFEEEIDWNWCSKGSSRHYWHLFEAKIAGHIKSNPREVKSVGWYSIEEVKKLTLEPVWKYWFEKIETL